MFKLILLGPYSVDKFGEHPSAFTNPDMICHFEQVLSIWMWHPKVREWFLDQIGYGPVFRMRFNLGTWQLESHGWRDETDTTLFLLTFSNLVRQFKVEPMTKLDLALAAHEAVVNAKPEDRDAAYMALLKVLATFPMDGAPRELGEAVITTPVNHQSLKNKGPTFQMITIMADLAKRGITLPPIGDSTTVTERFVHGLLARVD
jgi:hypothetical protein